MLGHKPHVLKTVEISILFYTNFLVLNKFYPSKSVFHPLPPDHLSPHSGEDTIAFSASVIQNWATFSSERKMMGPESQGEPDLPTSKDASMETLALDDEEDLTSKSYSNGRSADKMVSDSREPLSPSIVGVSADSHPLSSPPHPIQSLGASDSRQDSHLGSPSCAVSPPEDNASFVGEVNGSHSAVIDFDNSVTISRFRSSDSTYLKVVVSDPEKVVESSSSIVPGGNTFYTYLITAETNLADYGGSIFTVRRRFNDVVILADRLSEAYRGFFIPPRPDKSVVESQMMQKQDFAEQRRVALERYLQRLAVHPVIKKSDELRVFLQVQGRLPLPSTTDVASRMLDGAVKLPKQIFGDYGKNSIEPQDVVQPARNGRDLLRLFKEMKQSVVNDWGKSKPLIEEDDKEFLEKKERLHDLEQHLSNSSKQVLLCSTSSMIQCHCYYFWCLHF